MNRQVNGANDLSQAVAKHSSSVQSRVAAWAPTIEVVGEARACAQYVTIDMRIVPVIIRRARGFFDGTEGT